MNKPVLAAIALAGILTVAQPLASFTWTLISQPDYVSRGVGKEMWLRTPFVIEAYYTFELECPGEDVPHTVMVGDVRHEFAQSFVADAFPDCTISSRWSQRRSRS